jgi:hypothetical protein
MATEAQIEANRRNARCSTGPRTTLGKARSAMNALNHGVYSEGAVAIPRGPFAEEPRLLEEALEAIAVSLQPRDAIEWQQARRVAGIYNRLRRLDDFEAHALGADTGAHSRLVVLQQMVQHSDIESEVALGLYEALANPEGPDTVPEEEAPAWDVFAPFVVDAARPEGKGRWVKDLWTKDRVPVDGAEWRKATLALLLNYFGDLDAAIGWVWGFYREQVVACALAQTELLELAARRALDSTLATTITMSGRLGSQLHQQLAVFHQLAARELNSAEADEDLDREGADDGEEGEPS